MRNDLRLAARILIKERGFSVAAIGALTLALAAVTTIFTIVNAVLLRALPIEAVERTLTIGTTVTADRRSVPQGLSYLEFQAWRQAARTFDDMAGYFEFPLNVADDDTVPERVNGVFISANAFRMIGARPLLGRAFLAADDRPGAEHVVVLGHAVWTTRYGSDPSVIGRAIRVGGVETTVVGVMPARFGFPQIADLWMPLAHIPDTMRANRSARGVTVVARVKSGVTVAQASADLSAIAAAQAREFPEADTTVVPRIEMFSEARMGRQGRVMLATLMTAVGLVLLIACANVANLLLARSLRRGAEVALRLSLGAARWQIVRQLLIECLLVSGIAGAFGLALSLAGVGAFSRSLEGQGAPYWLTLTSDWRVLAFVFALCACTTVAFGLVPALQTSRVDLASLVNEAARGYSSGRRGRRWTGAFVVAQTALTLILLTGASLSVHDLIAQTRLDAGIDIHGLSIAQFGLPRSDYPDSTARAVFHRQLNERLASLPSAVATTASAWPLGGGDHPRIVVDGAGDRGSGERQVITMVTIGERYFDTLGTSPVTGRAFTATDGTDVAIVNQRFAALHFPGGDALDRRIRVATPASGRAAPWLTIVGIVPNVRQHVANESPGFDPVVYVPYGPAPDPLSIILVRSAARPGTVASLLRDQMRAIDPDLALWSVTPLDAELSRDRWESRFIGTALGAFATIALLLASMGLYAVTAYAVSQRTRELGIRLALGAPARRIWWLVTRSASLQVMLGLLLGVPGAVAIGLVLQGANRVVAGVDPLTVAGVPLLLIAVAVAACTGPARRASRTDPVIALKSE